MVRPHQRPHGIVIDLDALGPPNETHRERGRQHQIDGTFNALRPIRNWPKRSLFPVERTNARAHLSAGRWPRRNSRRNVVVHRVSVRIVPSQTSPSSQLKKGALDGTMGKSAL